MQEFDLPQVEPAAPTLPKAVSVGGCLLLILAVVRLAMGWLMISDPVSNAFAAAWGNILISESIIVALLAILTLQGRMWSYLALALLTVLDIAGAAMVGEQFAMLLSGVGLVLLLSGYRDLTAYSRWRYASNHQESPASLNV